jgi:hypothetical protein
MGSVTGGLYYRTFVSVVQEAPKPRGEAFPRCCASGKLLGLPAQA